MTVETKEARLAREYLESVGEEEGLNEEQVTNFLRWLRRSIDEDHEYRELLNRSEGPGNRGEAHPCGRRDLESFLEVWGLNKAEAARTFGVSRQAMGKWLKAGVPEERRSAVARLGAATDLLRHYLKKDRIPAVVRRPSPAREGGSLLEIAAKEGPEAVVAACREMFDFSRANSPEDWRPFEP